ncbi:MAG TPA: hypothetical protein VNZ52_17130 [Candidatus Thermoplasmatota archaeon]|nr:hypothetical protein [Candidatus Thermoplasmatota archaeon]
MPSPAALDDLPFIDEHARVVAASPEAVWAGIGRVMTRVTRGSVAERYARAIRCDPISATGAFPAEGSAIAAFRVARAAPPRELVLAGRHRFSEYQLVFRLDPVEGKDAATRLRAETRAVFPGALGRAYRLGVITTGGHAFAVRRILAKVAKVAERQR